MSIGIGPITDEFVAESRNSCVWTTRFAVGSQQPARSVDPFCRLGQSMPTAPHAVRGAWPAGSRRPGCPRITSRGYPGSLSAADRPRLRADCISSLRLLSRWTCAAKNAMMRAALAGVRVDGVPDSVDTSLASARMDTDDPAYRNRVARRAWKGRSSLRRGRP